jgi:hypothetical protein
VRVTLQAQAAAQLLNALQLNVVLQSIIKLKLSQIKFMLKKKSRKK